MAATRPIPGAAGMAAIDLGLSPSLGGALGQQVAGETEEERKKRMAQMQQMQSLGPAGSLAVGSIFGGGSRGSGY